MANSIGGARATQKCYPPVEREQSIRTSLVERGPALLEGAALSAPKIFWEPTDAPPSPTPSDFLRACHGVLGMSWQAQTTCTDYTYDTWLIIASCIL